MEDLKSRTFEEIEDIGKASGLPSFKAKEIFRFIHHLLKDDIGSLSVLNLEERYALKARYDISRIALKRLLNGNEAVKASFELPDGAVIETVLMKYEDNRRTLCISCQSGCPVGCLFCNTGRMGFKRNLTVGEILSQVYFFAGKEKISNIVFMGMGEPFLNYDNVIKAARILNHPLGQNISSRKIKISTIGIVTGIKKLAEEKGQFRLAWSLVAPSDKLRGKLIPLKKLAPIDEVVGAIKEYQKKSGRRITIEYVVLKGVNDGEDEIKSLIKISRKLDSHVNLIPYNPSPALPFRAGDINLVDSSLKEAGVNSTVRKSFGRDIMAACGQLCDD